MLSYVISVLVGLAVVCVIEIIIILYEKEI